MKIFLICVVGLVMSALAAALIRLKMPRQSATRKRGSQNTRAFEDYTLYEQEDSSLFEEPEKTPETRPETVSPRCILLHVIAADQQPYTGYELLQALLANGLRYGKDKIFHRYEQKTGGGSKLFSLTTVNPPGTFDLPTMGKFTCPGLTLFFIPENTAHAPQAFELMLQTAHQLIDDLGGEIWGENRQPLTTEAITMLRENILNEVMQEELVY